MPVLIKRKRVIKVSQTQEIIINAETVNDAIMMLRVVREEDIENVFKCKTINENNVELILSTIDADDCIVLSKEPTLFK